MIIQNGTRVSMLNSYVERNSDYRMEQEYHWWCWRETLWVQNGTGVSLVTLKGDTVSTEWYRSIIGDVEGRHCEYRMVQEYHWWHWRETLWVQNGTGIALIASYIEGLQNGTGVALTTSYVEGRHWLQNGTGISLITSKHAEGKQWLQNGTDW